MKRLPIELMEAMSSTGSAGCGETHADLSQVDIPVGAVVPMDPPDVSGGADPFPVADGMVEVVQAAERARGHILDIVGVVIPPELRAGGRSPTPPTPMMGTSDAAALGSLGTEEGGDRNMAPSTGGGGGGTPPGALVAVRCANDCADLHPNDVSPTLTERNPGAGQVPAMLDLDFIQDVQLEALAKLQAERDQLSQTLMSILSALLVAMVMWIGRIERLEARAAQLQRECEHLTREGEALHEWREVGGCGHGNAAIHASLREMRIDPQAGSGSDRQ